MPQTTDTELQQLHQQISELEDKRNKLIAKQQLLESHPLWQLAEEHHAATCHHNHADGCDWYYHEWGSGNLGYAKGVSLHIAARVESLVSDAASPLTLASHTKVHDSVVAIFKALKER